MVFQLVDSNLYRGQTVSSGTGAAPSRAAVGLPYGGAGWPAGVGGGFRLGHGAHIGRPGAPELRHRERVAGSCSGPATGDPVLRLHHAGGCRSPARAPAFPASSARPRRFVRHAPPSPGWYALLLCEERSESAWECVRKIREKLGGNSAYHRGAPSRNRTGTALRPTDFKSGVSTNFTIGAQSPLL